MSEQTVLYAEDDEDDRFWMAQALGQLSVPLLTFSNGQELLEYLQSEKAAVAPPKLIFLDLKMPVMSGHEALRWLRKQDQFRAVPIAILSASSEPYDLRFCFENGANAYFEKVSNPENLRAILERVLAALPLAEGTTHINVPENYFLKFAQR